MIRLVKESAQMRLNHISDLNLYKKEVSITTSEQAAVCMTKQTLESTAKEWHLRSLVHACSK
jgi:hypothetical protein